MIDLNNNEIVFEMQIRFSKYNNENNLFSYILVEIVVGLGRKNLELKNFEERI